MKWIWYIIAALGAGIGTGLAGLSAATVMVPILIVLCPSFAGETGAYQATAISLASDILGSAVTTCTYAKHGNIDLKRGWSMLLLHFWPQISTVPLAVQTLACIGRLIHTLWQTQDQDPVCSQVMGGHAGHVRGGLSLRYVRAALLRWARHGSGCGCRPPGRDCGGRDGAVLSKRMGHGDCSRGDTARVDCGHMNAQNGNSKSFTKGFASGMIVQDGLW